MPFTFRFRLIPFIAALCAVALGIVLGQWQTRRAEQKAEIEARMQVHAGRAVMQLGPAPMPLDEIEYSVVRARGQFRADWPLYLDNRPQDGQAGFVVLMPLQLEGSDVHVLVARGWVPRNLQDRLALPPLQTPPAMVEIEGLLRRDPPRVMDLGSGAPIAPRAMLQNLTPAQLEAASGLKMLPYIVEQRSDSGDGLQRHWPAPSLGIDKHRGYALQWYGLAAAAGLFFLVTGLRRARRKDEP